MFAASEFKVVCVIFDCMFEENITIPSISEAQCDILIENDLLSIVHNVIQFQKQNTTAMRGKCNYNFPKFDQNVASCTAQRLQCPLVNVT